MNSQRSGRSAPFIIGAGIHTCLGRGVAANVRALREPLRGPDQVTFEFGGQTSTHAYHLLQDEPLEQPHARIHRVLEQVIEEAIQAAQLEVADRRSLALFIGSSSGDISLLEAIYRDELRRNGAAQPLNRDTSFGHLAAELAHKFGIAGPDFTINTACTASANALLHAATLIRRGEIRHALIVGIELCNAITALGFSSLQLLGSQTMRPFDRGRNGLVLGEACAAVVLSAEPPNAAAWRLLGGSTLCDTYSPSAAAPDGSTIAKVIEQALRAAQTNKNEISVLKVHGTASAANDEAEAAGTRAVFDQVPLLCALKPRIGHTLGACGLAELVLLSSAAHEGFVPATPGIASAETSDAGMALLQATQPISDGCLMLNYFGFGGSNTSLVLAQEKS